MERTFSISKNKETGKANEIVYPNVDNVKIFSFIDEVRKNKYNNAIHTFGDFRDIEIYLKKQWAGMMYNFLTNNIETRKVSDLFEEIHMATEKIEYYTKQVARTIGDQYTNAILKCYDIMLGNATIQDLKVCWGIDITPHKIIREEELDALCDGQIFVNIDDQGDSITWGGPPYMCSEIRYNNAKISYVEIRKELLRVLEENFISVDEFLQSEDI